MSLFQAAFLGLLQGLTEFLPISSSGHLVVAEILLDLKVDQLKDFDVTLHLGTLLAILIYFRRDIFQPRRWPLLILATLPAAIAGVLLEDTIDAHLRNLNSIAILMIVMGLLYFIPQPRNDRPLTWGRGIAIGFAQMFALIPGVSRSGSTIFTGMMLGIKREEAAKFSFMLGAVAITGAGLLTSYHIAIGEDPVTLSAAVLVTGFVTAFFSSWFAADFLMKFLHKHGLQAFGYYRIALGLLLLAFF
jgi:undecaprenyl-diphosphatase